MSDNRGFLFNYPKDVVYVINGIPVTTRDILKCKQERQQRRLEAKRGVNEPVVKPCFVWVFYVPCFPYMGWWLYVKTLKGDFRLDRGYKNITKKIIEMYPCGLSSPTFDQWCEAFSEQYHRSTQKRPQRQGMTVAWAKISGGYILEDVLKINSNNPTPNKVLRPTTWPRLLVKSYCQLSLGL